MAGALEMHGFLHPSGSDTHFLPSPPLARPTDTQALQVKHSAEQGMPSWGTASSAAQQESVT